SVLVVYLFYVLSMGSTTALGNAVTFHHLPKAKSSFGGVRVWGTVGWVVVAWFAFFWLRGAGDGQMVSRLPSMLKLSAVSSFVFSAYALTLPRSFALTHKPRNIIPIESLRVVLNPKILLVGGLAFMMAVCNKYYYFGMGPFLKQMGVGESSIMPFMSVGQIAEIFAMLSLGIFLKRFGFKAVMILGVVAQGWRFAAFTFFGSPAVLTSGVICHGINFAFFMTAALIFVDSRCDKTSRTGVHQLIAILNGGLGGIVGNMLAGKAADHFTDVSGMITFRGYWSIPLAITAVCLIATLLLVPRDHVETEMQIELDEV
ncbi:MAG: MFS transporter, partial [Planctomycetes bacterium]|nr:MFS transporter [Planctomycetota bacterium]